MLESENDGANIQPTSAKTREKEETHETTCSLHTTPERKTPIPILTGEKKRNPPRHQREETRSTTHHGPTNRRTETPHHVNPQETMRVEKLNQPSAGLKGGGERKHI
ncbi:hypothetical protein Bca4012_049588 [Brassica carinata]